MKAMKVITIVCWLIVAAVLLGFAGWFITGTVFGSRTERWYNNISFGSNYSRLETLTGPYEVVGVYNVGTSGLNSINIDWLAGSITIKPHDGDQINITEYAQRNLMENEKLETYESGGTLTIRYRERGATTRMPQKRLEVLVPRGLSENLTKLSVDSVSSSITADSFEAVYLTIDSISGSVTLSDSTASDLKINTTSGSINVTSVHASDIELDSISGSIRISDSSARTINCDSTSGSINIYGEYGRARLNSISGRLTLNNSEPRSSVNADSTSGTIDLSGAFETVRTDSLSGSITIKSSSVPSSLKADSTSGSITVAIPNEGSITVYHSSTSGRFSSDIPVVLQGRGAQVELSTLSGRMSIVEYK